METVLYRAALAKTDRIAGLDGKVNFAYQTLTNPDRIRVTENDAWMATSRLAVTRSRWRGLRAFSERSGAAVQPAP